jgi:hypothetical protein
MKPRQIIALYSPWPQCGKSTVAKRLVEAHGYLVSPLAHSIKEMLEDLLRSFMPSMEAKRRLWGDMKEEPIPQLGGLTARRLMQTLGTEWGRNLDPEFWLKVKDAQLGRLGPSNPVVVDDMRFPNEFEMLKKRGAVTVKVLRRGGPNYGTAHASEGALNEHVFDYVIPNYGGLTSLYAAVDDIALKIQDVANSTPEQHY